MKEFEKWLKGKAGIGWYTGAEEGWKAALKWIYYDVCPEAWDVGDVEFDIEQELKYE